MLFARKKVLTYNLSLPLSNARSAEINIKVGTGNLTVSKLINDEQLLAEGTLQYIEKQEPPSQSFDVKNDHASLALSAHRGRQLGFRLPWSVNNGIIQWDIRCNSEVALDVTAYSGGGNVKLDFTDMRVADVVVDTGGGNVDLILPDETKDLNVTARTGGGNVTIRAGSGMAGKSSLRVKSGGGSLAIRLTPEIAAKVFAKSGWGKVVVDPRFGKITDNLYQTADYEKAINKIVVVAESGAGNVSVTS